MKSRMDRVELSEGTAYVTKESGGEQDSHCSRCLILEWLETAFHRDATQGRESYVGRLQDIQLSNSFTTASKSHYWFRSLHIFLSFLMTGETERSDNYSLLYLLVKQQVLGLIYLCSVKQKFSQIQRERKKKNMAILTVHSSSRARHTNLFSFILTIFIRQILRNNLWKQRRGENLLSATKEDWQTLWSPFWEASPLGFEDWLV